MIIGQRHPMQYLLVLLVVVHSCCPVPTTAGRPGKALAAAAGDVQRDSRRLHQLARQLLQDNGTTAVDPPLPDYGMGFNPPKGPRFQTSFFQSSPLAVSTCPDTWDWRDQKGPRGDSVMKPIKFQGQCGSCWAFAAVATIEMMAAWSGATTPTLSEQQLVDCVTTQSSHGCSGGQFTDAYDWVSRNGIVPEATVPYQEAQSPTCPAVDGPMFLIDGYATVPTDEGDLKRAVCNSPVAVAIHASKDFKAYQGGVFDGPCSDDPNDANHAVVVVGYGKDDSGQEFWIVRNSWAETWGEKGYVRMAMGSKICGITNFAAFPRVKSTAADKSTVPTAANETDVSGPSPPPPTPDPVASGCAKEYLVVEGDTLSKIAAASGVDAQAILDVNPQILSPDLILAGDKLNIPPCSDTPSKLQAPRSAACATNYTLQPSQTLWELSRILGVPLSDLLVANNITMIDLIAAGEVVLVPQPCNATDGTSPVAGGSGLVLPGGNGTDGTSPVAGGSGLVLPGGSPPLNGPDKRRSSASGSRPAAGLAVGAAAGALLVSWVLWV